MNDSKIIYEKKVNDEWLKEIKKEDTECYSKDVDLKAEAMDLINSISSKPNLKRMAQRQTFVDKVKKLAEYYEIATTLKESETDYTAVFNIEPASYSGEAKNMIAELITMCDEIAIFNLKGSGILQLNLIYYFHDIYVKNRKITDLN